jgi:AcrR family transcriptional regulator
LSVDESTLSARQEQAAATRRQLLAAAVAVFEEKGYQATTVGAITDRANTAHGTFYLYFRNKEDAFCQVIEAVIVGEFAVETLGSPAEDPREAIEESIRNFVSVYYRHEGLWRALMEGMLASSRVQQLWMDLRRYLVLQLSAAFEAQQAAGALRPFPPTLVAHVLAAMTEWSSFTYFLLDEPGGTGGQGEPEALVATLSDLWYRSVYGRVPEDGDQSPASA